MDLLKVSNLLDVWADETDDVMDHDELHAASVIAYEYWRTNGASIGSNPQYVIRWIEGCYHREQAIRERENRG